jgi:hypothetical protein
MAQIEEVAGGTLGEVNIAAAAAVALLNPLTAQLDAMLLVGLGAYQADLAVQLSAQLALSASLSLSIGDPLSALRLAIAAVAQLQAALTLALSLPPIQLSVNAQISTSVALAAALQLKLGLIKGLIQAALQVKIPAVKASAEFAASLSAGPVVALSFDGIADNTSLAAIGGNIASKFAGGLDVDGTTIGPGDPVSGVILVTRGASVYAALGALITTA